MGQPCTRTSCVAYTVVPEHSQSLSESHLPELLHDLAGDQPLVLSPLGVRHQALRCVQRRVLHNKEPTHSGDKGVQKVDANCVRLK